MLAARVACIRRTIGGHGEEYATRVPGRANKLSRKISGGHTQLRGRRTYKMVVAKEEVFWLSKALRLAARSIVMGRRATSS